MIQQALFPTFAFSLIVFSVIGFRELKKARIAGESSVHVAVVFALVALLVYVVFVWDRARQIPQVALVAHAGHFLGLPLVFGGGFLLDRADAHERSRWPGWIGIGLGALMLFVANYV